MSILFVFAMIVFAIRIKYEFKIISLINLYNPIIYYIFIYSLIIFLIRNIISQLKFNLICSIFIGTLLFITFGYIFLFFTKDEILELFLKSVRKIKK